MDRLLIENIHENNQIILNHQYNYLYSMQLLQQAHDYEERISVAPRPLSTTGVNNRSTESIIQDYVISYIFEPQNTENLQNVIIYPTYEQIDNATRFIIYDSLNVYRNTQCPITLEQFQDGDHLCEIIQCGHIFKHSSLMNWFSRNVRCPLCRHDIRDPMPDPIPEPPVQPPNPVSDLLYDFVSQRLPNLIIDVSNVPMVSSLPAPRRMRYRPNGNTRTTGNTRTSGSSSILLDMFQNFVNTGGY